MTMPEPKEEDVQRVYDLLFAGWSEADDLVVWYRELTYRLSVVQAATTRAQLQRAQTVAHMHETEHLTYTEIANRLGDLDRSRVGQLVAKGRPHITPLGDRLPKARAARPSPRSSVSR